MELAMSTRINGARLLVEHDDNIAFVCGLS